MLPVEELNDRLEKAVSELEKQKEIVAIYLFGSYASGRNRPTSDVDLAVLLKTIAKEQYLEKRLDIMAKLTGIIQIDDLDLIVLNEAPAGLAYRIISEGRLLYLRNKDRDKFVNFKARVFDRYLDYLPVQKMFSAALGRRIREGKFGGR